jgi:hypothetical protein
VGTPGAANSQASGNVAPLISDVKHAPAVPKPGQSVRISCTLTDESAATALTAQLFWRNATSTNPGAFAAVAMPATAAGNSQPRSRRKSITPSSSFTFRRVTEQTRGPGRRRRAKGKTQTALYQVDDEAVDIDDAVYRLIMTASEEVAFENAPTS